MKIEINGFKFETKAKEFAYDNCHKFYIIQTKRDRSHALDLGYDLYPMEKLASMFRDSCPLRFIQTWKLKTVVPQFEPKVRFEWLERYKKHWLTFERKINFDYKNAKGGSI